ncbi:next to BRCA1 gene 1 protein isoform X1, partial [Tachysurus ichikawai]
MNILPGDLCNRFVASRLSKAIFPLQVKRSFGLCSLQLTYFDEENEEVSVNSQLEYEEALKSAARQGNRLQMNVYESRGMTGRVPGPVPGPGLSQVKSGSLTEPKKGFRPPQHCPSLAQAVTLNELKNSKAEDKTPPAWFTSYMEKVSLIIFRSHKRRRIYL